MNELPLADDAAFWSHQMTEHALFLSLMISNPEIKTAAERLHRYWQDTTRSGANVSAPLSTLIGLKEEIAARQAAGEWLGWALPSFVKHILMEARYFQARIAPAGTSTAQDVQTWIQVVKDHADVGPKLLDPTAPEALVTDAKTLSLRLGALQRLCGGAPHIGCLAAADRDFAAANAWVDKVPLALSVIPPILADHIKRENARGQMTVRLLASRGRS